MIVRGDYPGAPVRRMDGQGANVLLSFICDDLATLCKNLVNVGPVTLEFTKVNDAPTVVSFFKINISDKLSQDSPYRCSPNFHHMAVFGFRWPVTAVSLASAVDSSTCRSVCRNSRMGSQLARFVSALFSKQCSALTFTTKVRNSTDLIIYNTIGLAADAYSAYRIMWPCLSLIKGNQTRFSSHKPLHCLTTVIVLILSYIVN